MLLCLDWNSLRSCNCSYTCCTNCQCLNRLIAVLFKPYWIQGLRKTMLKSCGSLNQKSFKGFHFPVTVHTISRGSFLRLKGCSHRCKRQKLKQRGFSVNSCSLSDLLGMRLWHLMRETQLCQRKTCICSWA